MSPGPEGVHISNPTFPRREFDIVKSSNNPLALQEECIQDAVSQLHHVEF